MSVHRNHFEKHVGQNLFKKYSKFQIFNEILCSGLTRFRDIKLGAFRQYQNLKTILKKKNMEQNRFKILSKFQKFQQSNFTLTCSNKGKMNGVEPDITYSKELHQKMKIFDKLIAKKYFN